MAEFTMPSLGADMEQGLLLEWLVGPGDRVSRGDVVAVVETDKAAIEVECFDSGTVEQLLVQPGTRVPVGTPLAMIAAGAPAGGGGTEQMSPDAGGPVPSGAGKPVLPGAEGPMTSSVGGPMPPDAGGPMPPDAAEPVLPSAAEPVAPGAGEPVAPGAAEPVAPGAGEPVAPGAGEPVARGGGSVGPLVRHLADVRGVDLGAVHGTGRGGRITRADVEHAGIAPAPPRVRATPYARRVGYALGVDVSALHGTADGGAVRGADVYAAVRAPARPEPRQPAGVEPPPVPSPVPAAELAAPAEERGSAMRRAIGELMSRSKKEVPHYYLSTTIDLAAAQEWLHRRNRGRPPSDRLVPAALLLKAAALAAREVPQLNGFWKNGEFTPGAGVHLGVAVSLRGGGLLAPVIRDADTHAPEELMATLKDLVQRARLGRLRGSEVSGATLTVTNLGEQGVEAVFGVIYPPQVALVGFGAVVERPWATGGLLGVRPVVTATLSADHRASDGAVGARCLTAVDRLLQKPEEL